jgi:hypothetical protein
MDFIFQTSRIVSIGIFLFYGWLCLASAYMTAEFERYGLPRIRKLTGILELAGAIGLIIGYAYSPLVAVAAGCLCMLMLLAVGVRIRVGDSLIESLPAVFLCVLNAFILAYESGWISV